MKNKGNLKVLITGASRGLGLAMAKKLSSQYSLILHASKDENLDNLRSFLGKYQDRHHVLCADFSNHEEVSKFCKQLKKQYIDSLYGVINNAGVTFNKSLLFQPERDIDTIIQVNLKAPILINKTALKIFALKKKGIIINVSSCVGEIGNAFQAVYAATKAGLVALTKSLAKEVSVLDKDHSIRILSISPGFIETEMTEKIPDSEKEKYLANIPSNRFGKSEEVAEVITFLLSEKATYINGTDIKINGGIL